MSTETWYCRSVFGSTAALPILCSCGGNSKRVLERLLDRHRLADELEAADRLGALDQLVLVELEVVEVGPPLRLLLAPVVLEQLREQPARVALLRVGEQLGLDQRALLEPLLRLLLDLALLGPLAPLDLGRPQLEQPAMELVERAAVVLVVGADLLEDLALAHLEPLLERDHRAAAAAHLLAALEAVERLDLLDRVAVEREPERLADDPEEIDEHLAAQQVVELGLARAVLAHQPLQRRPLVRRVVVDVHPGVPRAPLLDQVEKPLEALLLLRAVERPDDVVLRHAVVVEVDPAEQVLEPARRLVPGIALEVEPDVARARLGQEGEAALGLEREDLVLELAGPAPVELERGLVAELRERLGAELGDLGLGRRRERLEVRDPGGGEPVDLSAADPGDEREVQVALPLLLAEREELAERTVVDRVRVGRPPVLDRVEKPPLEPPVVGEEVVRPKGLALGEPVDDVHLVRPAPLNPSELLGVEAELEDVRSLGPASELGVDDLVRPVGLKLEKVREPAPVPVDERRLVDDRRPVPNRLFGRSGRGVPTDLPRIADLRRRPRRAERGRQPRARPPSAESGRRTGSAGTAARVSSRATASRSDVRCGQAMKSLSAEGEWERVASMGFTVSLSPRVQP